MKRELVKLGDPIEPYLEKYKNDIAIMEHDLKQELANLDKQQAEASDEE